MMMMMMMMMIMLMLMRDADDDNKPVWKLGLWKPSSEGRDVSI